MNSGSRIRTATSSFSHNASDEVSPRCRRTAGRSGAGPFDKLRTGPSKSSKQEERGVLAVLRRDGVLLPFAAFNGRQLDCVLARRSATTGVAYQHRRRARSLVGWAKAGIVAGLADRWTRPAPRGPDADRVSQLLRYSPWAFARTTPQPKPPPPVVARPFPKDGLGVSGGVSVEAIEVVDKTSAEWNSLAIDLVREFDRVEDREVLGAGANAGWKHPLRPAQRKAIPIRLESWYRVPDRRDRGLSLLDRGGTQLSAWTRR